MSLRLLFVLLVASFRCTDAVVLLVEGLCPAVYTPFDENGKLNVSVVPAYAKYLKDNHIDGVLLAGTSGEGPALSMSEKRELLDAWLQEGQQALGLKVVMQVGGQAMPHVLEMAQYAEKAGADAILSLPELYYKAATNSAMVRYLRLVSEAAPKLPILYYHHPSMSGVNINVLNFFKEATATIPNFKGMKCDFLTSISLQAADQIQEGQRLFMLSHNNMAANLLMGFNSTMTAGVNIFPKLFVAIHEAMQNKDIDKARQLQLELNERISVITSLGDYVTFGKTAFEMLSGVKVGSTRDPLSIITSEQRKALRDGLQEIDVKFT